MITSKCGILGLLAQVSPRLEQKTALIHSIKNSSSSSEKIFLSPIIYITDCNVMQDFVVLRFFFSDDLKCRNTSLRCQDLINITLLDHLVPYLKHKYFKQIVDTLRTAIKKFIINSNNLWRNHKVTILDYTLYDADMEFYFVLKVLFVNKEELLTFHFSDIQSNEIFERFKKYYENMYFYNFGYFVSI